MTLLWTVRVLLALTAFTALLVASYAVASAPGGAPNYLGVRGLKRARALNENPLWAQVEPLVRWLGVRVAPLLTQSSKRRLERQITGAGDFWGLQPEEIVSLSGVTFAAGLIAGVGYGIVLGRGMIYVIVAAVLGAAAPYLYISGLEEERRRRIQNGLPHAIDLLALGLSAGLDFPGSLRQVVEKSSNPDDPLVEELNLVLQELQVGKTRREALLQFVERVPGETVREFVGAVVQAEERGNPLSDVLRIQAETSRQRRSVRAEELASKAGLKMIMPMVLLFGSIMLLIVGPLMLSLADTLGD
jgi:tight adherence protein C